MADDGDKSRRRLSKLLEPERLGVSAILSALVVGMICFGFFVWVMTDPGEGFQTAVNRSRAVAPFIGLLVALVTFMTVLWRGAINQQQAYEDKRQNDSADEANLATLVETAAAALSKADQQSQLLGISMLKTVVTAPSETYADYALDQICSQIEPAFQLEESEFRRRLELITVVLQSAHQESQRFPTRSYEIVASEDTFPNTERSFSLFFGFPPATLYGASIYLDDITERVIAERDDIFFRHCLLQPIVEPGWGGLGGLGGVEMPIIQYLDHRFSDSVVARALIGEVVGNGPLVFQERTPATNVELNRCSLSGCVFSDVDIVGDVSFVDCSYAADNPPVFGADERPIDEVFPDGIDGLVPIPALW
ncbi:hypothetical protein AB1P65_06370 [Roseibium alexandrii]